MALAAPVVRHMAHLPVYQYRLMITKSIWQAENLKGGRGEGRDATVRENADGQERGATDYQFHREQEMRSRFNFEYLSI